MFKADDWEDEAEKMHLESGAGDTAGNIIEADNWITNIKQTVCDSGSSTTIVDTWQHCMQYSLLNLWTSSFTTKSSINI